MDVTLENDDKKNQNSLINLTLAKFIGVYQLLNPKTSKYRGYNIYHVAFVLAMVLYELPLSIMSFAQFFYYSASDMNAAILSFTTGQIIIFACYKTTCIIYHSKEVWQCLKITGFAFTSYGRYNSAIFETWRTLSIRTTYALFVMSIGCFIYCLYSPLLLEGMFVSVRDRDGFIGKYRMNQVNVYLFMSAEMYNKHFNVFYAIETAYVTVFWVLMNVTDMLVLTLCLAITCRFQMISDAFKSIEQNYFDVHSTDDTNSNGLSINEFNTLLYKDLITILKDHQKIMVKYETFLSILGPATLIQIITSATTFVTICFILTMSFVDGKIVDAGTTMKMITALPTFLFQVFVLCYLFEILNEQKDSVVFALYSSNWTEMDMKCKKLILLAMKLNNANQMKLKFSNLNVVNLQLFYKTMRICYSMISMLINSAKQDINP